LNPFSVVSLVNAGRAEWRRRLEAAGLIGEEKAARRPIKDSESSASRAA
jgi:hypothetical protein